MNAADGWGALPFRSANKKALPGGSAKLKEVYEDRPI